MLSHIGCIFAALEFELRAYTLSHSTSPFMSVFELGSGGLFAWTCFEP
jgi:hypothetical protein